RLPPSSPLASPSPPPTDIAPLSLHDALPIFFGLLFDVRHRQLGGGGPQRRQRRHEEAADAGGEPADGDAPARLSRAGASPSAGRSEEHTSELQSRFDLVCRLLLEKKKQCSRH